MQRFNDFLKIEAQYTGVSGDLARYLLLRADVAYMVQDKFSYLRDKNIENNSYPSWSNEPKTVLAYIREHCPEFEPTYHQMADTFRSLPGNSKWENLREPEKSKPGDKVEVDWAKLKRNAGRKRY